MKDGNTKNKGIFTMSAVRTICLSIFLLALLACEQPFKAGLGTVVDVRAPSVYLDSPEVGAKISGSVEFKGHSNDDYRIDSVQLRVTALLKEGATNPYQDYTEVELATDGTWTLPVETIGLFNDGNFIIRLMVTDRSGKTSETGDIGFVLKNDGPQISLSTPKIVASEQPGMVVGLRGDDPLNYGWHNGLPVESDIPHERRLGTGSYIVGMIRDSYEIYKGVATNGQFPPGLRLWLISDDPGTGFPLGTIPDETALPWTDLIEDKDYFAAGPGTYSFMYTLPSDNPNSFYALQMRVQGESFRKDSFGRDIPGVSFSYPENLWSEADDESRYVLFYIRPPDNRPQLNLWHLEDINPGDGSPSTWNGSHYGTINDTLTSSPLDNRKPHPYIIDYNPSKNGSFTLRVWASHSDGIQSAEAYFEKDDGSIRGRFIWDPANERLWNGWSPINNVPTGSAYSQWGYRNLNPNKSVANSDDTTRSFIFTYDYQSDNTISNDPGIHPLVRGKSKVHVFNIGNSSQSQWDIGKKSGLWSSANDMGNLWSARDEKLPDGTYTIEVYSRSSVSNTPVNDPLRITLNIDSQAPKMELFSIDTGKTESAPDGVRYTVNGVIEPRLSIIEDRVEDSGRRSITGSDVNASYYLISGTNYTFEDRFILVKGDTDREEMRELVKTRPGGYDYWPPTVASSTATLAIPGISSVRKHGAIGITGDGRARFKTSSTNQTYAQLEAGATDPDALENGDYYLFMFSRDRAFNVGVSEYHLNVDHSSDYPEIISKSLSPNVTKPDQDDDGTDSGFKDEKGDVRNRINERSDLALSLIDDDALDMANSVVGIEFVGSYMDANGKVQPYTADMNPLYVMKPGMGSFFLSANSRESAGTILQSELLGLLRAPERISLYGHLFVGDAANYNRLPDGLYQISIITRDDPAFKLKLNTDPNPPRAMQVTRSFWIAVDTKLPEIFSIMPAQGMYVSTTAPLTIEGKVSDQNGPVTYVKDSAKIKNPQGVIVAGVDIGEPTLKRNTANTDLWEATFSAVADLKGKSGEYSIEMQFQDRFGNISTMSQRYMSDNIPPTVSLSRSIRTFERQEADLGTHLQLDKSAEGISRNKSRLANEIISFVINASDNSKVVGVRWWLLPADISANATGLITNADGGQVTDYNASPSKDPSSLTVGAYGEVDVASRAFDIRINTSTLNPPNGEYRLHIIARDEAGNISASSLMQEVFILQEEDKPFFGVIRPSGGTGVDEASLVVNGSVSDDDGFGDILGYPDAIQIWIKNGTSPDNLDIYSDHDLTAAGYTGPKAVSLGHATSNPRTINLNFKLKDIFPDAGNPGLWDDGEIHYIVKATDAPVGKYSMTAGTSSAERISRRQHYSFVYDNKPPEIVLSSPVTDTSFGLNSDTAFVIKGSMKDANLSRNGNGNYYFRYRLGTGEIREWELVAPNAVDITYRNRNGNAVQKDDAYEVGFTIPASRVAPLINAPDANASMFAGMTFASKTATCGFRDDNFPQGSHTLTVLAVDKTGNESSFVLSFIKDTEPPEFSFANIKKKVALDAGLWWDVPDVQKRYHDRWDWLLKSENELDTVYYSSGVPELRGTFSDKTSDIDTAAFEYSIDGNPSSPIVEWSGDGKNQIWMVYLTDNGKSEKNGGTPLDDGVHSISFKIRDTSGNELDDGKMYGFRLDSAEPRVTITADQHSVFGSAAEIVTLKGIATDANIKDVRLRIVPLGATAPVLSERGLIGDNDPNADCSLLFRQKDPANKNAPIAEEASWSYTLTNSAFNPIPGSSYNVIVYAVDQNNPGRKSEETVWAFTVDNAKPVIKFDSLNESGSDFTGLSELLSSKGNYNYLSSENLAIRGTAEDRHSPVSALQSYIWRWDYGTGAWVKQQDWTPNWTPNPDTPSKEVNWSKNLKEGAGGVDLDDGLYRIQVRAKDSSWTEAGTNHDGTDPVWLSTDIGNPAYSNYVYFFYDRKNPELMPNEGPSHWSSERYGGKLEFTGTAKDDNRLRSITATVYQSGIDVSSSSAANRIFTVTPLELAAENAAQWDWTLEISVNPGTRPTGGMYTNDGLYTVEFKAIDLAGREATTRRAFFLDNTPPLTSVLSPALRTPQPAGQNNASVDVSGGQGYVISGSNEDTSGNSSESGVAAMWYHLGYLDGMQGAAATLPTESALIESVIGAGKKDSAKYDAAFDALAGEANGNAWFKYESGSPLPTGFEISNFNTLNWNMKVPYRDPVTNVPGGLKQYAGPITVKGRQYNASTSASLKMSELIPGTNGLYRMPMWIRVTDTAGNVGYFSREIWIYPDGDIPRIMEISNPSQPDSGKFSVNEPRGGAVPVVGVASHLTSVYSVIYRVFADDKFARASGSNAIIDDRTTPPANNRIVTLTSVPGVTTPLTPDNAMYNKIPAGYSRDGWYIATLDTSGATVPWNFIINTNEEITGKIDDWGFNSITGAKGSGSNSDRIRVWMEVVAFSGEQGPDNISERFDRVFYLKKTAPQIKNPELRTIDKQSFEPYSATKRAIRGDEFTIKARLDAGSGSTINRVQVRRPYEENGGSGWVTIWEKDGPAGTTEARAGVTLVWAGGSQTTGPQREWDFEYRFNTRIDAPVSGYAAVRKGEWKNLGGTYRVQVRINDNSGGYADCVFDIGIDNFAPVADPNYTTSSKVAGSAVDFIGRAIDYQGVRGQVSGISPQSPPDRNVEKIYAWFTKGSGFVNINTGARNYTGTVVTMTALKDRHATVVKDSSDNVTAVSISNNGGGKPGSVSYPHPLADGWVREISEAAAAATATDTRNRILWIPGTGGDSGDIRWSFRVDTTKLPDGPITLNYVVLDNAGNASFYEENMVVMNNCPQIESVTLYTNNRGNGAVFTAPLDEDRVLENASASYRLENFDMGGGYLNSGFISKNKTIGFGVQTYNGKLNYPLYYSLQYVTREKLPLTKNNLNQMILDRDNPNKISLYTIAQMGSYSARNWMDIGVPVTAPKEGTHFVFTPAQGLNDLKAYDTAKDPEASIAYVWRYSSPLVQRSVSKGENNAPLSVSPDGTDNFNFTDAKNTANFFDIGNDGKTKIKEFKGSRPANEGGTNNPSDTAFFLIRLWDSVDEKSATSPGYNKNDQLYDAVVVGMNVYLSDTEKPKATFYDLNPYTETAVVSNNKAKTIDQALDPQGLDRNILRGGLYNDGTTSNLIKSGHVEPRNGTTALRPNGQNILPYADGYWPGDTSLPVGHIAKNPDSEANTVAVERDMVSGKVILRGRAHDDQLIREIRVHISDGSFGSSGTAILALKPDSNNIRTLQAANSAQAMAFEVMDWRSGHTVEWACVWDTEQAQSGAPRGKVTITVTVVDDLGSNGNGLTSDGKDKTVDIVPYIRGFERRTQGFDTKRSRQGWYSFYQGEASIAAVGYNLKGSGNTTTMSIVSGTSGTVNTPLSITAQSVNSITFSMPTNAASGKIVLNTNVSINGSTEALNHRSSHAQSWNREDYFRTPGSDLWINKPYAHVWRSQESATAPATYFGDTTANGGSKSLESPSMSLFYGSKKTTKAGLLHGAWASYTNAAVYRGFNTGEARIVVDKANRETDDPFSGSDIVQYNGQDTARMVYAIEVDGFANLRSADGANIQDKFAASQGYWPNVSGWTRATPTKRWLNNRVAFGWSSFCITSYDSYKKNLLVSRGTHDMDTDNASTVIQRIDGNGAASGVKNNDGFGSIAASANAGIYSAVDYVTSGSNGTGNAMYAVVAYYDQANDTIRLAYADSGSPSAGSNWTRRYVLSQSHPLFRGSGTYVSMKVDKLNGIHLAFFNSTRNTLVYAYAKSKTDAFTAYTVDNVVRGGVWTDISVDDYGNPWIVYGDTSRIGNYDGARIAYKSGNGAGIPFTAALRDPVTETDITGWEAVQMPSNYRVNNDRLNIEAWPPTNRNENFANDKDTSVGNSPGWNAAVGYGSDMFRIAYFYNPAFKEY